MNCTALSDQDPVIRPLVEQDSETLQRMFPEIPLWVKNPDYDRVCKAVFVTSLSCCHIFCVLIGFCLENLIFFYMFQLCLFCEG